MKSKLHDHKAHHDHDHTHKNIHHHTTHSTHHHVGDHGIIKNLLKAFTSVDDHKESITVILFLFFCIEMVFLFFTPFAGKLLQVSENRKYIFYRTPLTPPPLS
jgi:hypothetical protein